MEKEGQMSESFILALLLALVGGFFDAYTYICRDQVFANAQTGNIVKVGMSIASKDYIHTLRYFIPILAFCLGIMLTMFIRNRFIKNERIHWRQIILIIEMIIVFVVGWIPIKSFFNVIANVLVSFICAMQVEAFRKFLGRPFASTMCTGNLRSGTEYLYQAIVNKDKKHLIRCLHYYMIIVIFILGAIIGVWLTSLMVEKAIFMCIGPMFVAVFIMIKKKKMNHG